jgi:hypothetical protein
MTISKEQVKVLRAKFPEKLASASISDESVASWFADPSLDLEEITEEDVDEKLGEDLLRRDIKDCPPE